MSGTWNHLRQRTCGTEQDLMSFIKKEVEYQGKIEAAGAGREASHFWGTAKGPTVILWDSLDEETRTKSETIIRERRDWVV